MRIHKYSTNPNNKKSIFSIDRVNSKYVFFNIEIYADIKRTTFILSRQQFSRLNLFDSVFLNQNCLRNVPLNPGTVTRTKILKMIEN